MLRSVLLTISYPDQFHFPLTVDEIYLRLIHSSDIQNQPSTLAAVEQAIDQLVALQLVVRVEEYAVLRGREHLIEIRQLRAQIAKSKQSVVSGLVSFVSHVPWVLGMYVTGALAMENSPDEDDVDVMVITSSKRLWLVRGIITFLSTLMGRRRTVSHHEADSWCFNLWLEHDALAVPEERRSIYTAYEVLQARPVFTRDTIDTQYLAANAWVTEYIPNLFFQREQEASNRLGSKQPHPGAMGILDMVWESVNTLFYLLQYTYMKAKITRERVTNAEAYFHPRNTYALIMQRWQESLLRVRYNSSHDVGDIS